MKIGPSSSNPPVVSFLVVLFVFSLKINLQQAPNTLNTFTIRIRRAVPARPVAEGEVRRGCAGKIPGRVDRAGGRRLGRGQGPRPGKFSRRECKGESIPVGVPDDSLYLDISRSRSLRRDACYDGGAPCFFLRVVT